jgi:DNA repair exonuclease SbcCD nuclease subunit
MCEVVILKGNHDFIQSEKPFFEFLHKIKGVTYVNTPYEYCDSEDCNEIFLPHSKNPRESWKDVDFNQYDFAYLHQCVIGSTGANDFEMEHGLDPGYFKGTKCKIISGDIHVPQIVGTQKNGMVEYVGTPYPVSFGDHYKGRCVLIKDGVFSDLHLPTIQKMSLKIKSPDALKVQRVKTGDQVSVKMLLSPSDFCNWPNYKKKVQEWAESKGVLLHNVSLETDGKRKFEESDEEEVASRSFLSDPKEILRLYADREKLDTSVLDAGLKLL